MKAQLIATGKPASQQQLSQQRLQELSHQLNSVLGNFFWALVLPFFVHTVSEQLLNPVRQPHLLNNAAKNLNNYWPPKEAKFVELNANLQNMLLNINCYANKSTHLLAESLANFELSLQGSCKSDTAQNLAIKINNKLIEAAKFFYELAITYLKEYWRILSPDGKLDYLASLYKEKSIYNALKATCSIRMQQWVEITHAKLDVDDFSAIVPAWSLTSLSAAYNATQQIFLMAKNNFQTYRQRALTMFFDPDYYSPIISLYFFKGFFAHAIKELLIIPCMKMTPVRRIIDSYFSQLTPFRLINRYFPNMISLKPVSLTSPTNEYLNDLESFTNKCLRGTQVVTGVMLIYTVIARFIYELPPTGLIMLAGFAAQQGLNFAIKKAYCRYKQYQENSKSESLRSTLIKNFGSTTQLNSTVPTIVATNQQVSFEFSNYDDVETFQHCLRQCNIEKTTKYKVVILTNTPLSPKLPQAITMYAEIVNSELAFKVLIKQINQVTEALNIDFQVQEDWQTNQQPAYACTMYLPHSLYSQLLPVFCQTYDQNKIEVEDSTQRITIVGSTAAKSDSFTNLLETIKQLKVAHPSSGSDEEDNDVYTSATAATNTLPIKRTRRSKQTHRQSNAPLIGLTPTLEAVYYTWACALGNFFYQAGNSKSTAIPLHSSHHVGKIYSIGSLNQTKIFVGFRFLNLKPELVQLLIETMKVARVVSSRGKTGHVLQKGIMDTEEGPRAHDIKFKFLGKQGDMRAIGTRFTADNDSKASIFVYHTLVMKAH